MPHPRVVITGIGVVSPFGVGRERFWQHISRGCSGTRAITDFDTTGFACRVAAPVIGRDLRRGCRRSRATIPAIANIAPIRAATRGPRWSAVIAAREAWNDAGLRAGHEGAGVIIGSGGGGIDVGEKPVLRLLRRAGPKVTPYAIPISIVGMMSSEISISLRLRGVSHVLSCGCTSSTDAIGYAAALTRTGEADVVLSGGADACVTPGMMFGFSRMRVMSTAYNDTPAEASRPFDRGARRVRPRRRRVDGRARARGLRARARGARIYASIDGYGSTCDAYHRVQMAPDGQRNRARDEAGDRALRLRARRDRLRQLSRHVDRR